MALKSAFLLFLIIVLSQYFNETYASGKYLQDTVFQYNSKLNKEKLESLKSSDKYVYSLEESQTNWWSDFKEWLALQWKKIFGEEFDTNSFWGKFFDILPYIILAIAVVLLVWFITRSNPGNQIMRQHQNSKVILTEEDELLMKRNLDKLANEAIDQKNYRLAVRYLYLNCIKRLDIKNIIRYANDKTNYEYIKEIEFSEISKTFNKLTLVYEQIWYGQLIFDKTYFQHFKDEYDKFHQSLENKQYAKA